jgi:hypothetical protein
VDTVIDLITVGIALVALAVSIRADRRQTGIQARLAAIEEARRAEEVDARTRARVTASIVRPARGEVRPATVTEVVGPPPTWLVVHNEGPALARGVQLEVEQGPQIPTIIGLENLPVDLQPGQPMAFQVVVGLVGAATMRVTVHWTDGAGDHEAPFTFQTYQ